MNLPRINLNTASRDKLIAHIDTLEDILTSLMPDDERAEKVRRRLGMTMTEARIMVCLMNGRCHTRQQLRASTRVGGDPYESKTVDVMILRLRRKLEKHRIEIRNDWGSGFYIDADNLKRLRAVMGEAA